MRITLDYYRILSVPIQADLTQLDRAYQDRLQQQPRHQYSERAIASREKLLEQAHSVLADAESRAEYDKSFFVPLQESSLLASPEENAESEVATCTVEPPTINPYIEIEPDLFVGALIILYDLAEYEIVLRLGLDYLNREEEIVFDNISSVTDPTTALRIQSFNEQKPDILLCLALSYLEISREQWRKENFENAAISGQMGLNLLQREQSLFPSLQAEIAEELDLLKPYRILELLAKNPPDSPLRNKGLQLVQEMLSQQEGLAAIDSNPSGLKPDQFLCFIQQIRTFLTLQEQKEVFLAETKRGSHAGSCVAAYALIAEGYSQKKPSSILEAQKILQDLSDRQDTNWERAICALLLGQTNKSEEIIQQTKDTNILQLIQKRSENSPDLLPGLCFYGEQWLQQKVLSQFQDLRSSRITLEDYFCDRQVQAYLDRISPIPQNNYAASLQGNFQSQIGQNAPEQTRLQQLFPWWNSREISGEKKAKVKNRTSNSVKPTAKLSHDSSEIELPFASKSFSTNVAGGTKARDVKYSGTNTTAVKHQKKSPPKNSRIENQKVQKPKQAKTVTKSHSKNALLLVGLIAGIGTLGFVITKMQLEKKVTYESLPTTQPPELETPATPESVETPNTTSQTIPKANPEATSEATVEPTTVEVLDRELAKKVVQTWLNSKSAALGKEHKIDSLDSILTGSLLTQWRNIAQNYQQNSIYRQFEHNLDIRSVKIDPNNPDLAVVEAGVREVAQHYQQGKIDSNQSYDDNLVVRYELIRQNGSWAIKNSTVL